MIAWAAGQDWCDGSVATYGASYSGRIQWLTALHQPPALAAMIVLVTPADPFVEDPTGVPGPMHIHWYRMTDGRGPAVHRRLSTGWTCTATGRCASSTTPPDFTPPLWREECRHQTLDEWWEPVRYQHRIGEVDVPVLHISGWYDDEEIATPANFAAMTAAGRSGQRLLMGPWGHQVNAGRKLGELDFGHQSVVDLESIMTGFLDEKVRGRAPAAAGAPGAGLSHGRQPLARPERLAAPGERRALVVPRQRRTCQLPLRRWSVGRRAADGESPPDQWVHDPGRPVPFITAASSAQIGGPDDYAGVETRGDVLVYTGEVLTEPLDVIGPVRLVAHVATSANDTDVTAKLLDVHPTASHNGSATGWCGCVTARDTSAPCWCNRAPCTRWRW